MKNLFLLIPLLLCLSCDKFEDDLNEKSKNQESPIEPLLWAPNIIDGIIHFESSDEMQNAISFLSKMLDEERFKWEEKHNFISIDREVENAFCEIDYANSIEQIYDIVERYSHVIELKDDAIKVKIKPKLYRMICNNEGLYVTSDFVNEVKSSLIRLFKLEDYNKSKSTDNLIPIFQDNYIISSSGNMNTKAILPTGKNYLESVVTVDKSGCKNDRRLTVWVHSYKVWASWTVHSDPAWTYTEYSAAVELEVFGERKYLCFWSQYKSHLKYQKCSYAVTGFRNSQGEPFLYHLDEPTSTNSYLATFSCTSSPEEVYSRSVAELHYVGNRAVNELAIVLALVPGFNRVYVEATSTGIGDRWAIIDYRIIPWL